MIFNKKYFLLTIILFITEVLIAMFLHDQFIRPYGGDVLVVILIYCFIRTFFKWPVVPVAMGVLLFAFAVEGLQYLRIVELLGLRDVKLARIIIGTDFAWHDMLAYIAGIITVLMAEKIVGYAASKN